VLDLGEPEHLTEVEVIDPPELRAGVREVAARIAVMHACPASGR
jgi:hypothetical protein